MHLHFLVLAASAVLLNLTVVYSAPGDFLVAYWYSGNLIEYNAAGTQVAIRVNNLPSRLGGLTRLQDGRWVVADSITNYDIHIFNADFTTNVTYSFASQYWSVEEDAEYYNYGGALTGFPSVNLAALYSARLASYGCPIFDLVTGAYVSVYKHPTNPIGYEGVAVVTSTSEVWAASFTSGVDVFNLNTRAHKRRFTLTSPIQSNNQGLWYSPVTNTIFFCSTNYDTHERNVDSTATHVRTFVRQGATDNYNVIRRHDNGDIYTVSHSSGKITRHSSTGTFIAVYPMSGNPIDMVFVDIPNTNQCLPDPCQNGATCVDGNNDYTCNCPAEWTGKNCTISLSYVNCTGTTATAPVPSHSVSLSGSNYVMSITFQQDRSITPVAGLDVVKVAFGGTGGCDLDTTGLGFGAASYGNWTRTAVVSSQCLEIWGLSLPISTVMAECGFVQDPIREPGRTHFTDTISISTNQTRTDLRTAQYQTASTSFKSDVSIANQLQVSSSNVNIFGQVFALDLLGNLLVTVVRGANNVYIYMVSGQVVTTTQYPYRLELSSDATHAHFNQTSGVTAVADHYCDQIAVGAACQQMWNFSTFVNSNIACTNISQLTNEWVQMLFAVNCSSNYAGECAPVISQTPSVNFTLTSPNFCPTQNSQALSSSALVYKYDALTSPTATEWLQGVADVPAGFSVENTFVYESYIYGQVAVNVAANAATLASTTITAIRTVPTGYATKTIYADYNVDGTFDTRTDATVEVANTGFGTTAGWNQSRARFQFKWSANTLDRDNSLTVAADAAQAGSIEIDMVVSFVQGQSVIASDDGSMTLQQLKSFKHTAVMDLSGTSGSSSSRFGASTTFTVQAPPSSSSSSSSSDSSSAFSLSGSQGMVAVVGGVAVVALVVVVAIVTIRHRHRAPASSAAPRKMPSSSSFPGPADGTIPLETVAAQYMI